MIASATDRELAKQIQYLKEESKILRVRIPGQIHTKPAEPAKGIATEPGPWLDKNGKPINWHAGLQYDDDVGPAKKALAEIGTYYPGATKYEVASFFFWQGEKDGGNPVHAARYDKNLVNFIKSLRKDFNSPHAKLVLGTMGEAKKGSGDKVMEGQLAVNGTSGTITTFRVGRHKSNILCIASRTITYSNSQFFVREIGFFKSNCRSVHYICHKSLYAKFSTVNNSGIATLNSGVNC